MIFVPCAECMAQWSDTTLAPDDWNPREFLCPSCREGCAALEGYGGAVEVDTPRRRAEVDFAERMTKATPEERLRERVLTYRDVVMASAWVRRKDFEPLRHANVPLVQFTRKGWRRYLRRGRNPVLYALAEWWRALTKGETR